MCEIPLQSVMEKKKIERNYPFLSYLVSVWKQVFVQNHATDLRRNQQRINYPKAAKKTRKAIERKYGYEMSALQKLANHTATKLLYVFLHIYLTFSRLIIYNVVIILFTFIYLQ